MKDFAADEQMTAHSHPTRPWTDLVLASTSIHENNQSSKSFFGYVNIPAGLTSNQEMWCMQYNKSTNSYCRWWWLSAWFFASWSCYYLRGCPVTSSA